MLRKLDTGQPTRKAPKTIMNSTEYDDNNLYKTDTEQNRFSGHFVPDLFYPTSRPDYTYGVNVFVNQFSLCREN